MMNPPAPMMGGMNMPPMEAAGSMPPAMWGLKPAFFIIGMVKAPGGDGVGDGAAGDGAEQAAGDDRHLGRSADLVAHRGQRKIDEEVLGPALFQKGAEQDEQDHIGGQHVGHDAEHPVALVEDAGAQVGEGVAGMGEQVRGIVARRRRRAA